jgi:hypothetical protein
VLQAPHSETVKLQPAWQTLSAALWAQQALTWVLQAPQLMWVLQSPHSETVKLQPAWQTLSAALWAQQALTWVLQGVHVTCRLQPGQPTEGTGQKEPPVQLTTTLHAGHGRGPWGLVGKSLTERFLKRNSAIGAPSRKKVWRLKHRRSGAAPQGVFGPGRPVPDRGREALATAT